MTAQRDEAESIMATVEDSIGCAAVDILAQNVAAHFRVLPLAVTVSTIGKGVANSPE